MPLLESNRLKFVPFTLELKIAALYDRERVEGLLGIPVPQDWPEPDLAEALPFFIKTMEQDASGTVWDGIIILKAENVLIGCMGFKDGPDAAGSVEIGYGILPQYQKRGYATEMANCLIDWAFKQPEIMRVTAECLKDNCASIRVLEKIGMQRVGLTDTMITWEVMDPGLKTGACSILKGIL